MRRCWGGRETGTADQARNTSSSPRLISWPGHPILETEVWLSSSMCHQKKFRRRQWSWKGYQVPILKTMKLHAVVAHQGTLVSQEVSYFDTCCWQDGVFQQTFPGWVTHVHLVPREEPPQNNHGTNTEPQEEAAQVPPPSPTPPEEPVQAEDQQLHETELEPDWNVGDFVAAEYNGETFAGKITEVDDCEYNITFMEA